MMFEVHRSSKLAALPLALLLLLAGLLARPAALPALDEGETFSTFLGTTLDGSRVELAALRGERVVVVEFWATWAPPSLRQHEALRSVLEVPTDDFVWISVSLDRDPAAARAWIDAHPSTAIHVCDGEGFGGPWAQRFGVVFAPALYVIGKEGNVRIANNGVLDSREEVEMALNAGLAALDEARLAELRQALGGAEGGAVAGRPATAVVNQPMPDFVLKPVNRPREVAPEDFAGKVLLVVVFASWDSNSVEYLRRVHADLFARYQPNGFEILGITIEKDEEALGKWIKRANFRPSFPIVVQRPDEEWSVTHRDGAFPMGDKLPRAVLIGKNGYVRDVGQFTVERIKQVLVEDLNVPI